MGDAMASEYDTLDEAMVLPNLSKLTPAQVRQVELYGWCRICGSPREVYRSERKSKGKTIMVTGLVCPNDHSQD